MEADAFSRSTSPTSSRRAPRNSGDAIRTHGWPATAHRGCAYTAGRRDCGAWWKNLLVNALVHGRTDGQPAGRGDLGASGADALLVVEDRGPGVPPELSTEVFERRRRPDSPAPASD